MEFPVLVFKDGGPNQRAGGSYSHQVVQDADSLAEALKSGWFATLPEAIEGVASGSSNSDDDAPPTRAELEAKAKELGLQYHHKTGDAKLAAMIKEALEA